MYAPGVIGLHTLTTLARNSKHKLSSEFLLTSTHTKNGFCLRGKNMFLTNYFKICAFIEITLQDQGYIRL